MTAPEPGLPRWSAVMEHRLRGVCCDMRRVLEVLVANDWMTAEQVRAKLSVPGGITGPSRTQVSQLLWSMAEYALVSYRIYDPNTVEYTARFQ